MQERGGEPALLRHVIRRSGAGPRVAAAGPTTNVAVIRRRGRRRTTRASSELVGDRTRNPWVPELPSPELGSSLPQGTSVNR